MTTGNNEFSKDIANSESVKFAAYVSLLDNVSARDRRSIAIRFLRSHETMASLLRKCAGTGAAVDEAKLTMACVLLMVRDDAPKDLVMTDPGLYEVLRKRITDARLAGWMR